MFLYMYLQGENCTYFWNENTYFVFKDIVIISHNISGQNFGGSAFYHLVHFV